MVSETRTKEQIREMVLRSFNVAESAFLKDNAEDCRCTDPHVSYRFQLLCRVKGVDKYAYVNLEIAPELANVRDEDYGAYVDEKVAEAVVSLERVVIKERRAAARPNKKRGPDSRGLGDC